jgi:peptidoglycan/LPS O-acetylase OafA/YrhL
MALLKFSVLPGIAQCGFFFFLGVATFVIFGRTRDETRAARLLMSLAIAALAGLATVLSPGYGASLLGTGGLFAAATLALTAMEPAEDRRMNGFWAACGDASYGMYLWHVPLQVALFVLVTPYVQPSELAKSPWFLVAYLSIVCTVARVMFLLFERPMRGLIRKRFSATRPAADSAVAAP